MNIEELKTSIDNDLEKLTIPSGIILDKLRVVDENSRKSSAYVDSSYVPFYYYLGKYLTPTNLLEIGVNLGFFSCAFFKSCSTVKDYLAFQENVDDSYSQRLMVKNIRDNYRNNFDFYYAKIKDQEFLNKANKKWDLVFINGEKNYDKYAEILDLVWENLSEEGMMIIESVITHTPSKDAFTNFSKNKESIIFKTRYGTGVVIK